MDDMSKYSDYELTEHITYHAQTLAQLTTAIEKTERKLRELETERERRQLAAYWEANPTLTPVAVGDKLIMSQVGEEKQRAFGWWEIIERNAGKETAIKTITPHYSGDLRFTLEGVNSQLEFEIADVLVMRRAYLEAHANDVSE